MNNIIKALNLTEGSVLTLEKLPDRMEFEAITLLSGNDTHKSQNDDPCGLYLECTVCLDENCHPRYISLDDCHPYNTCSANNCRPVQ